MYFVTIIIILLITAYYVKLGRKFLSLDRIAEPSFVVNWLYLINFPVRAFLRMFFGDLLVSSFVLEWDIGRCNVVLIYASACILVFNFSYEYFKRRRSFNTIAARPVLPLLKKIRPPTLLYFALLGGVVLGYWLAQQHTASGLGGLGKGDIPQIINAIQFALDASIIGLLIMFLLVRRRIYLVAFVLFFGLFLYSSFIQTAKYGIIAYLFIIMIIMRRFGIAIRYKLLGVMALAVVFIFLTTYSMREFGADAILPNDTQLTRILILKNQLRPTSMQDNSVLLKISDRFQYLDTFMVYLQALDQDVRLDLYDKLGSLPTYKIVIPSIFGVDKSTVENIHAWFGNKYWYGLSYDHWGVIIPFGRITESFMILSWAGFLLFIFYSWLFAWLYRRFFCSPDPLLVIYYCLIFYYYILVDDCLLFNFSAIVHGTIFYFGSLFILRKFVRERQILVTTAPR